MAFFPVQYVIQTFPVRNSSYLRLFDTFSHLPFPSPNFHPLQEFCPVFFFFFSFWETSSMVPLSATLCYLGLLGARALVITWDIYIHNFFFFYKIFPKSLEHPAMILIILFHWTLNLVFTKFLFGKSFWSNWIWYCYDWANSSVGQGYAHFMVTG